MHFSMLEVWNYLMAVLFSWLNVYQGYLPPIFLMITANLIRIIALSSTFSAYLNSMKVSANIVSLVFKSLLMIFVLVTPAYAYLDPGTGSMIIQMAIAGVLSALFAVKMYWYRIRIFVYKALGKDVEHLIAEQESLLEDISELKEEHKQDSSDDKK